MSLAAWVHFLPGHPGGGFERPGGALEQALTNCLFCLQAADGRAFDAYNKEAPSFDTAQRWRLACALGGLFFNLADVLSRVEVASEDGQLWPAAAIPLLVWLEALPATKYHYRWNATPRSAWSATYAVSRCIDPVVMSHLARGDGCVADALLASIGRSERGTPDLITEVVDKIALAIAARSRSSMSPTSPDQLVTTLKRLFATSDWLPNSPGGHVWYARDGLYLLWPEAAIKIIESLPRDSREQAGFASHESLLRHLVAAGVIDGEAWPLVRIRPPGYGKPQLAVRFAKPEAVLEPRGPALDFDLSVPDVHRADVDVANANSPDAAAGSPFGTALEMADGPSDPEGPAAQEPFASGEAHGTLDLVQTPGSCGPLLTLDTSKVLNPRIRELVDAVVARLEHSFDKMLARVVTGGVFVALVEFVGPHGDGGAVVRALHAAGLLAALEGTQDKRVVTERMEGADVIGVVVRAEVLRGYREWTARWQSETGGAP